MKLAIFIFFTTSLISIKSYSQYKSTKIRRNAIFLEAGGLGGYGSINYEKLILHKNPFMSTIRVGISTYHILDFTNKFNRDTSINYRIRYCNEILRIIDKYNIQDNVFLELKREDIIITIKC